MNLGISSIKPRTFLLLPHKAGFYAWAPFATQMFQLPSVITMTIAATRTYRSLLNFVGGPTNMYYFLWFPSSPTLIAVDDSVAR